MYKVFRLQTSITESAMSEESYKKSIEIAKKKYGSLTKYIVICLKRLLSEEKGE